MEKKTRGNSAASNSLFSQSDFQARCTPVVVIASHRRQGATRASFHGR
jgi:hypothetical protein